MKDRAGNNGNGAFFLSILLLLLIAASVAANDPERYDAHFYPEIYREGRITDRLKNTSNLTDREIRWHFEHTDYQSLADALDRNSDSIADGTILNVHEFIERIRIVFLAIDAHRRSKLRPQNEPFFTATKI